jgi:hypothetical protein
MTFEYDKSKRFAALKIKFIYFFNSSIILDPIMGGRENSGICGPLIGASLLVACCVKAISIHIISGK